MPLVAIYLLTIAAPCALLICLMLIHEAGHAVGGLLVGFRVIRFRVGPFELTRGGKWKVRWLWKSWFGGVTGMCATSLDQRWIAPRFAIAILCGPLANLLAACILLLFSWKRSGMQASILGWAITFNLIFFVVNLIPASGKQHDSDGRTIAHLLTQRQRREASVAQLTYTLRLAEFKRMFETGHLDSAAEQLHFMEKVSGERKSAVLVAINCHLREHLLSGESLVDCKWEPPNDGVA